MTTPETAAAQDILDRVYAREDMCQRATGKLTSDQSHAVWREVVSQTPTEMLYLSLGHFWESARILVQDELDSRDRWWT